MACPSRGLGELADSPLSVTVLFSKEADVLLENAPFEIRDPVAFEGEAFENLASEKAKRPWSQSEAI
jgi:hypothetical protein